MDWGISSQTTKCTAPGGSTPLHVATSSTGGPRIAQILIDAGAAVDEKDDNGRTPLFTAICSQPYIYLKRSEPTDWSVAKLLLSRGMSVNTCDNKDVTPLMEAAEARNPEAVQWLLEYHAEVNRRDKEGQCAVHKIVDRFRFAEDAEGPVRSVLELLHLHGANFNTRDIDRETPLFSAIFCSPVYLLDSLRHFGADMNAQNQGSTLLHHFLDKTFWKGESDSMCTITTWLLDANIPIDAQNRSGETALLMAAAQCCPSVVRLLSTRGAEVTACDYAGHTTLFKCLDQYGEAEDKTEMMKTLLELGIVVNDALGHGGDLVTASLRGPAEIFDLLVAQGLDLNHPDEDRDVPLVSSVCQSDKTWTQQLLDAGADVTAANSDGTTALHKAASYENINKAKLLVSRGSRVAQVNYRGKTALHIALSKQNSALKDYLLEAWRSQGSFDSEKELIYACFESQQFEYAQRIADARDPGRSGHESCIKLLTELYSAASQRSLDLVTLLQQGSEKKIDQMWMIGLFRIAITLGFKDTLQTLLNFGLDIDGIDFFGDAPVHIAAQSDDEGDLMCVLLDAHADIEATNRIGYTPLLLAVEKGRNGTVKKLLERGANVLHANRDGDTALHLASTPEIVEALINAQADVNALNKRKKTPLHDAGSDCLATVKCLVDAGANVNARSSVGNSPLHSASRWDTTLLELFLKYSPDMTVTDAKGRTPLQIADMSGDKDSQAILRKYLESHTVSTTT